MPRCCSISLRAVALLVFLLQLSFSLPTAYAASSASQTLDLAESTEVISASTGRSTSSGGKHNYKTTTATNHTSNNAAAANLAAPQNSPTPKSITRQIAYTSPKYESPQNTTTQPQKQQAPQWMIDFINFRKRLFLCTVEPIIVLLLGPVEEDQDVNVSSISMSQQQQQVPLQQLQNQQQLPYIPDYDPDLLVDQEEELQYHRRLGFLPNYVEDVKYFKETSMSFATLILFFSLLCALFAIFLSCFYHNQKTSPLFSSPRRHRLPKLVPPPLPVDGYFKWVKVCFFLSDQEIIHRIGYDSLIFLRFHRLALRCIVKMSVFSFVVLLPLNFTGGGHANAQDLRGYMGSLFFTDFLRFTMANVSGGSPRLWVHCFAAYLLTAIVVRELLKEYETFNSIRHTYLLSREPHLRTVLVTNIPRHLRSRSKINSYFRHVYPQAVQQVVLCQNVMTLEDLVRQRTSILSQLEKELLLLCRSEKYKLFQTQHQRRLGQSPCGSSCCGPCCCCCSTSASASWTMALQHVLGIRQCLERMQLVPGTQERLTTLYTQLEQLNQEIEQEQRRRRRVMKMLDRMEAGGEGSREIDYMLALSHKHHNKSHRKKLHQRLGLIVGKKKKEQKQLGVVSPTPPLPPQEEQMDSTKNQTTTTSKEGVLRARSPITNTTTTTIKGPVASHNNNNYDNMEHRGDVDVDVDPDHEQVGKKSKAKSMTKARLGMQRLGRMVGSAVTTATATNSTSVAATGNNNTSAAAVEAYIPPASEAQPPSSSPQPQQMTAPSSEPDPQPETPAEMDDYQYHLQDNDGTPADSTNKDQQQHPSVTRHSPSTSSLHIENHLNEVCDKAFVVMQTFTAATIAIQSMHSSRPGSMQVSTAPEPRDILWNNIYISKGATRTRSYIGEVLVLLIITFYVVPIALVSLLVSESALISSSPRLEQLDKASAFFSSSIAMVQPLCVVGIQQLLPPLFMYIGRVEGLVSFSEVQMRAFSRYFLFQVLNIFLVTTISVSIFDTIAIIVENPEEAFEMLGNGLPRMSSFFITFVTMKTFLGLGLELVRTMSLVQATLRYFLFPNATLRTQRTVLMGMRAIDDPGWFPFHKILAQDMLVVVISVVFAVVAPLVLLPCALFCLFSRIMWTHHHLYVYESVFESGGQFWPKIFRRFVFGLIIAQMTITGQFILKEARHEAYATIALMFMTYLFLRKTRARFDPTSSTLPLEVATVMDIRLHQEQQQAAAAAVAAQQAREAPPLAPQVHARNESVEPSASPSASSSSVNMGTKIGSYDPYEHAYVQPALRANPKARPEQPFSPAQLGRDDLGAHYSHNPPSARFGNLGEGPASSIQHEASLNSGASVRLKGLHQQDRRNINRWWDDQLQKCGKQNILKILIGEECGKLTISEYDDNAPFMTGRQGFVPEMRDRSSHSRNSGIRSNGEHINSDNPSYYEV